VAGPSPGKIPLEAIVELISGSRKEQIDAEVYLHIKGWSRALVTHIDVESPKLNSIITEPRQGFYARCIYKPSTLFIIALQAIRPCVIRIQENMVFPRVFRSSGMTWCYIGGKDGGIYVGLRKEFIERFEDVARRVWGVEPR